MDTVMSNIREKLSQEILNLAVSPLVVPDDGCSHTQPVERLIKKITKVSKVVFSAERREQYVRAQEKTSSLRGKGKGKANFGMILFIFEDDLKFLIQLTLAGMLHIGD